MPDAGRDKMRECELLRNAICTHTSVVKVHGCTATPEAVYEYFKKKEVTAPALGFSDEWWKARSAPSPTSHCTLAKAT